MLDQLTSVQLSEWEAYDRIDPIGKWRDDFHMAYLATLIINTARGIHGKKGIKMDSPIDHMPKWDIEDQEAPQVKKQSVEEMKQILLGIAAAQNKKMKGVTNPPTPKKLKK